MSKPTDLVQGTLDLLIIKTLAPGPMHGWSIARKIRERSEDVLQVRQGSLHPGLHKLEIQGRIEAEWGESENNHRAGYRAHEEGPAVPGRGELAPPLTHRRAWAAGPPEVPVPRPLSCSPRRWSRPAARAGTRCLPRPGRKTAVRAAGRCCRYPPPAVGLRDDAIMPT